MCTVQRKHHFFRRHYLVSTLASSHSSFYQSVVLVIEHNSDGAFGLIINKAHYMPVQTIFKEMQDPLQQDQPKSQEEQDKVFVHYGGPLETERLSILYQESIAQTIGVTDEMAEQETKVMPNLYFSSHMGILTHLVDNDISFCLYHGYVAWNPNQLDKEFFQKSWVDVPEANDLIFESYYKKSTEIWQETLLSKGGVCAYFVQHVHDRLLN